jgi:hypothetical protein
VIRKRTLTCGFSTSVLGQQPPASLESTPPFRSQSPRSSNSQHGKERETSLTADFPDCQIPRPYRSPHGSRLSSLYCIHRIVASPAALPPRTHSFNRCIHLCRYPARPSFVHIRTLHQPTSLQSHPPKLINQLDAAFSCMVRGVCKERAW